MFIKDVYLFLEILIVSFLFIYSLFVVFLLIISLFKMLIFCIKFIEWYKNIKLYL